MQLDKEKLAILLASFDTSIHPLFPVTDDTDAAFDNMLLSVQEEHRQVLATTFMQLQNALFVKMGVLTREVFEVNINDPLLGLHSEEARDIFEKYHGLGKYEDEEPDGSYCLMPDKEE